MEISQKLINGQSLRCLEINPNAQKTLVVLHGWGGCIDSWKNFLTTLENDNLHILAFDLPGFGLTPAPTTPWQVKDYSNLVKSFIDSYNLKKINLLGHSFGGQIATQFAYDYPEYLEKLFLAGAAAIRPKKSFFRITIGFLAKILKVIFSGKAKKLRHFLYRCIGSLDYENLTDPIMQQTMHNVLADDLKNILPEIKTPTIIIWGEEDSYTPLKHGLIIKKLIPNNKIYILKNARHGLHLQQPAELKKIILENLN